MVAISNLIHFETLLQNATDIIAKIESYFITKYEKKFILQNASVFYHKIGQSLQNAINLLLQNATVFTKLQNVYCICLLQKSCLYN